MAFPIENKLVVAVSSSALFDLSESDRVYNERGLEEYRRYQEENIDVPLAKGVAFPFVKRLLSFNEIFATEQPVEVVLLSRNSPETGLRVFRTINHYGLDISRASFFSGESPYKYLPAFNASLFLSASERDVQRACDAGYAAGRVLESEVMDDATDVELRIAFDFDIQGARLAGVPSSRGHNEQTSRSGSTCRFVDEDIQFAASRDGAYCSRS